MLTVWRRVAELPGWLKVLMMGQLVSSAGALAFMYLTLYLVEDRGLSAQYAGFAAAAYGIGLLGGNLGGGWFGDRFGLREAALGSLLSWSVACALIPFAPGAWLVVLAAIAGACGGASRPVLAALVAMALPDDRRREAIALFRTASNAGFTIGPPLGGLLAAYDFDAVFAVDAVSSLLLAVVVWRWVPRLPRITTAATGGPSGVWRALANDRPVLVLLAAIIVVDTVYRQLYTTLPLMLRDEGAPPVAYGALIGINAVVIVLFETPMAVWFRHRRASSVVAAGFALVGAGFGMLVVWPALGGAIIAVTVITVGEMLYKPTATAHVADAAPEGMVGRFSSVYAAASISGMLFAPALGGTLYDYSPGLLWPVVAVAALLAGAVTYRLAAARVALPSGSTARPSSGSEQRPGSGAGSR